MEVLFCVFAGFKVSGKRYVGPIIVANFFCLVLPHLWLRAGNSGTADVGGEEEEVTLGEVDLGVKFQTH